MFQMAMSMRCSSATMALIGPRRAAMRRYFAPRYVSRAPQSGCPLTGSGGSSGQDHAALFLLLPVVTAYPATTPRPSTTDSTQSIGVSTLFWMT